MKCNLKEANISKNMELKAERYQYSQKQNSIGYLSRYTASALNSQSKLLTFFNLKTTRAEEECLSSPCRHFHQTNSVETLQANDNKYLTEVDFKETFCVGSLKMLRNS